jgi:hypothetical protein
MSIVAHSIDFVILYAVARKKSSRIRPLESVVPLCPRPTENPP